MLSAEEGNTPGMRKVKTHKFRYRQTYLRRAAGDVLQMCIRDRLYPMKGRHGAACGRMFCWEADNVIVDAVKPLSLIHI